MSVISFLPLDSGNTGIHPEGAGGHLLQEEEEDLTNTLEEKACLVLLF